MNWPLNYYKKGVVQVSFKKQSEGLSFADKRMRYSSKCRRPNFLQKFTDKRVGVQFCADIFDGHWTGLDSFQVYDSEP